MHDHTQIRVASALVSIGSFGLFCIAEVQWASLKSRVFPLVLLGVVGLLWCSVLTVLAGTRAYPHHFRLWQPFEGGTRFIMMQALGWAMCGLSVLGTLVCLLNLGHGLHVDGEFVLLGACCCCSALLLNASLAHYVPALDDADGEEAEEGTAVTAGAGTKRGGSPLGGLRRQPSFGGASARRCAQRSLLLGCDAGTIVGVLVSGASFLLVAATDVLRHRAAPSDAPAVYAAMVLACIGFSLGAAITHRGTVVGVHDAEHPSHQRQQRTWAVWLADQQAMLSAAFDPFRGGLAFSLLQAFAWMFLGVMLQLAFCLPHDLRKLKADGLLTAMGSLGLAGQLLQVGSRQWWLESGDGGGGSGGQERSLRGGSKRALFAAALPSIGCAIWSAVLWGALFSQRQQQQQQQQHQEQQQGRVSGYLLGLVAPRLASSPYSVALLACFFLFLSAPLAHIGGYHQLRRSHGYRLFQPFRGGTAFVIAQAFGWLLYGLALVLFTVLMVNVQQSRAARGAGTISELEFLRGGGSGDSSTLPYTPLDAFSFLVPMAFAATLLLITSITQFCEEAAPPAPEQEQRRKNQQRQLRQRQREGWAGGGTASACQGCCELLRMAVAHDEEKVAVALSGAALVLCAAADWGYARCATARQQLAAALRLGGGAVEAAGAAECAAELRLLRPLVIFAAVAHLLAAASSLVGASLRHSARGFRWWQPFRGGTRFMVLQAFGWTLVGFGLLALLVLVSALRLWGSAENVELPPLAGLFAGTGVVCTVGLVALQTSIQHFKPPGRGPERQHVNNDSSESALQLCGVRFHGSGAFASILAFVSIGCIAAADVLRQRVLAALSPASGLQLEARAAQLLLVAAMTTACLGACAAHCLYGPSRHPSNAATGNGGYRLYMPFCGGVRFSLLQGLGWALLALALLTTGTCCWVGAAEVAVAGALPAAGVLLAVAQALLIGSVSFFRRDKAGGAPIVVASAVGESMAQAEDGGTVRHSLTPSASSAAHGSDSDSGIWHDKMVSLLLSLGAMAVFSYWDKAVQLIFGGAVQYEQLGRLWGRDNNDSSCLTAQQQQQQQQRRQQQQMLPVQTLPVLMCGVLALFASLPLTYLQPRMQRHFFGRNVLLQILGWSLWSFAVLTAACCCWFIASDEQRLGKQQAQQQLLEQAQPPQLPQLTDTGTVSWRLLRALQAAGFGGLGAQLLLLLALALPNQAADVGNKAEAAASREPVAVVWHLRARDGGMRSAAFLSAYGFLLFVRVLLTYPIKWYAYVWKDHLAHRLRIPSQDRYCIMHGVTLVRQQRYGRAEGESVDVLTPTPAQAKQAATAGAAALAKAGLPPPAHPPPAFVYAHGGGWVAVHSEHLMHSITPFARAGYEVLSLDYPLSPEAPFPAALVSVLRALAWAKSARGHQRVVMLGDSAGGNLVSMAAALLCPSARALFVRFSAAVRAHAPELLQLCKDGDGGGSSTGDGNCDGSADVSSDISAWDFPVVERVATAYGLLDLESWAAHPLAAAVQFVVKCYVGRTSTALLRAFPYVCIGELLRYVPGENSREKGRLLRDYPPTLVMGAKFDPLLSSSRDVAAQLAALAKAERAVGRGGAAEGTVARTIAGQGGLLVEEYAGVHGFLGFPAPWLGWRTNGAKIARPATRAIVRFLSGGTLVPSDEQLPQAQQAELLSQQLHHDVTPIFVIMGIVVMVVGAALGAMLVLGRVISSVPVVTTMLATGFGRVVSTAVWSLGTAAFVLLGAALSTLIYVI